MMKRVDAIREMIFQDEDHNLIRSEIAKLILESIYLLKDNFGKWEKFYIQNAIFSLLCNINSKGSFHIYGLNLSLANVELAFTPIEKRSESALFSDKKLDQLTLDEFIKAAEYLISLC